MTDFSAPHTYVAQKEPGEGCGYRFPGTALICRRARTHDQHSMNLAEAAPRTVTDTLKEASASVQRAFAMPSPFPPQDGEAVIAFTAHADAVLALVRTKDAAYGGAWQDQGYMGNLARILSKTSRLKNMLWKDDSDTEVPGEEVHPEYESVMDTLHDLMALCAFAASNIEEGNRWGQ